MRFCVGNELDSDLVASKSVVSSFSLKNAIKLDSTTKTQLLQYIKEDNSKLITGNRGTLYHNIKK